MAFPENLTMNHTMRSRTAIVPAQVIVQLALAAGYCASPGWALSQEKENTRADAAPAAGESATTPRPDTPPAPPDADEFKRRPDEKGKVRFNFQGQPWLSVLEWLAEISELSLDWQDVPSGYLNLRTQRPYSLEEARDLINRHLLDRGFTLLKHGEILSVVNIRRLDPSLVPRLEPDDLPDARLHDFVRVSFPLDWMTAETAVDDLKPLISPNGKLTAIKSTNRLEVTDAVANLREIQKMLSDPQSPRGPRRLVREFRLQFVKATEVQPLLHKLLGLEKTTPGNDPTALMQQMAQIMKQAGVVPGQGAPPKQPQASPVQLVANARDNSILAHAPADQMAIIAEAIQMVDHPSDKSRSVLRNTQRVQVYPLAVVEPEAMVRMLQDLADLSPDTKLHVDRKNRALIAHANLSDHLTLRTLVDKLDGTQRIFRVIRLSRLDADYVAGSIDLVMGGGDSTKRPAARDPEEESRRFRVVADIERNRLLLWVNDGEYEDVLALLDELGEAPGEQPASAATVRVLDTQDFEWSDELLRRLHQAWPGIAPNPLDTEPRPKLDKAQGAGVRPLRQTGLPPTTSRSVPDRRTGSMSSSPEPAPIRLAGLTTTQNEASECETDPAAPDLKNSASGRESRPAVAQPPGAAAVHVERDREGRLVVTSQDAQAVELLQKLVREIAPPPKGFRVFRMKHKSTWAHGIAENVRQFFDERQKSDEKRRSELATAARWYDPSGSRWIPSPRAEAERRKQVRTPPKLIVDADSNSILAVGADAEQLRTIEELIEMYDTPESQEPHVVRVTRLVPVKHGQVKQIAETVKEVYRDLLSNTDSTPAAGQRRRWYEPTFAVAYGGREGGETVVKYKGMLSIGVDEGSSSVVVSAPEGLLQSVEATIDALDSATIATRPRIHVLRIRRGVDPVDLQKRLIQVINTKRTEK